MDFAKFVWSLQKKALFFCRCDLLGDPYEGYYTKALAEGEDEFVRNTLPKIEERKPETEAVLRSQFKSILNFTKNMRQELFLSCWHMKTKPRSSAMWKLCTTQGDAICVRSTFSTLARLLNAECFLGEVRYIDYTKDLINMGNLLNYVMHKRLLVFNTNVKQGP